METDQASVCNSFIKLIGFERKMFSVPVEASMGWDGAQSHIPRRTGTICAMENCSDIMKNWISHIWGCFSDLDFPSLKLKSCSQTLVGFVPQFYHQNWDGVGKPFSLHIRITCLQGTGYSQFSAIMYLGSHLHKLKGMILETIQLLPVRKNYWNFGRNQCF